MNNIIEEGVQQIKAGISGAELDAEAVYNAATHYEDVVIDETGRIKKYFDKATKLLAKAKYKGILYLKWWLVDADVRFHNWLARYPKWYVKEKVYHSQKGFEVTGFKRHKCYKMVNNIGENHGK
jgi:hypothetical protein